jgi:Fe-S cluster assembly protein SufD
MMSTLLSPLSGSEVSPWFARAPLAAEATSAQAAAWERFQRLPDPQRTDEDWRFADLSKARLSGYQLAPAEEDDLEAITRAREEGPADAAARFVFVNNRLVHAERGALPPAAVCLEINEAIRLHGDRVATGGAPGRVHLGGEKFAALHEAATKSGIYLHLPAGCVVEKPILVHHFVGGEGSAIFPHLLVEAEANASATVCEIFASLGDSEKTITLSEVELTARGGGAVQHVTLQVLDEAQAKFVQLHRGQAGRDARIKSASVHLGAAWVRTESINTMMDRGADCQIYSASLANEKQEIDQRTLQAHRAQHTTSDLLFKNALYDDARTIFSGLIDVEEGAHHTDSYQKCRHLLGSERAEANAMPGLEINADQVKCSHGATSGQISDEEIFYLQARGIPAHLARQMISLGFLNEVIGKLDGEEVKAMLFARVEAKFAGVVE